MLAVRIMAIGMFLIWLTSCAERPLPVATGPVRQLNAGHWTPGPNELTTAPAPPSPPIITTGSGA